MWILKPCHAAIFNGFCQLSLSRETNAFTNYEKETILIYPCRRDPYGFEQPLVKWVISQSERGRYFFYVVIWHTVNHYDLLIQLDMVYKNADFVLQGRTEEGS